jgi:hypothetical protein
MFTCNSGALCLPELWFDLNNERVHVQKGTIVGSKPMLHWSNVCAAVAPSTGLDLHEQLYFRFDKTLRKCCSLHGI